VPYTSLDSVRAYLVFDQGRRWAVGYYRTEEGFEVRVWEGAGQVTVPCVGRDGTLQLSRQVLDRIQTSRGGAESGFVRTFALNAAAVSEGVYSALVAAEKDLRAELVALELPSLVQEPYIPPEPVSPRPALNAAVAGTLGFLLTVFGVIVRDAWAAAPKAQGSAVGTLPEAR
jgi:hypothetical protein